MKKMKNVKETNLVELIDNNFEINKLINSDLSLPENSIPVWEKLGFLYKLEGEEKIKICSVAMTLTAKHLLLLGAEIDKNIRPKLEVIIFPIIRRIIQYNEIDDIFDFEKTKKFVDDLINDLTEKLKTVDFIKNADKDEELEFCIIYSKGFNFKKYYIIKNICYQNKYKYVLKIKFEETGHIFEEIFDILLKNEVSYSLNISHPDYKIQEHKSQDDIESAKED